MIKSLYERLSARYQHIWLRISGYYLSPWPIFIRFPGKLSSTQARSIFFESLFSMLAKMSLADGHISRNELEVIERFMDHDLRLNKTARLRAIDIFRNAKNSPQSFENYAGQFYQLFSQNDDMLELCLTLLLSVAYSDGCCSAQEMQLIRCAQKVFGIDIKRFARIKVQFVPFYRYENIKRQNRPTQSQYSTTSPNLYLDVHYQILGCKSSDPLDLIKKRYRVLALQYHPDRLFAQGMPSELRPALEKKFRTIQEAYESIVESRQ